MGRGVSNARIINIASKDLACGLQPALAGRCAPQIEVRHA